MNADKRATSKVVLELPGTPGSTQAVVRVSVRQFPEHSYVDIRQWRPNRDGVLRPATNGVRIERPFLRKVAATLREAEAVLAEGQP